MIVVGISETPINKIADHTDKHDGKSKIGFVHGTRSNVRLSHDYSSFKSFKLI